MSENVYSAESVPGFGQAQYPKPQSNENQSYFTYSPALLNTFSPNTNYINVCTNTPTQNVIRNQSSCLNYQDQVDIQNWDNRIFPELDKVIKLPDMIEISNKDLSPVSYCSNIDFLVPELYKAVSKDMNLYKYENQSYYSQNNITQRNYEYPSCVQYDKSAKYCALKSYDEPLLKSCSYSTGNNFMENEFNTKGINQKASSYDTFYDYNTYNFYDRVQENALPIQSDLFNSTNIHFDGIINNIDQQTEDSNEDSDIVVEESDDEQVSCEDPDKGDQYSKMNKCLICNVTYKPFGIQFYFLTTKSPLTMSSQMPVIYKIIELVGKISTTKNYLCSECLGLLNTIDHLQIKVDTFNAEFIAKYKKTCIDNNTEYIPGTKKSVSKINRNIKYKCKFCKRVLSLKKYLYFHLKKHKKSGFLCEYCGTICKSGKKFILHRKKHLKKCNSQKIDPFKCRNCIKVFRTKSQLKCHENYCLGLFPYECKSDHCDKKFATVSQLKNHTKLKHDKKFVAICSICNIGFVKMADYKNHKITHSTDKKYSCTKCDNSYKSLYNLRFHMKCHNEELPYACPICKKGFMRKEYFEAHVNKHNGIKKYGCTICQKKFPSQKNLESHTKTHENLKKLPCNICGKLFPSECKLKDHIRTHTNLKEFECDQCDVKFNIRDSLRKHVKKKHGQMK